MTGTICSIRNATERFPSCGMKVIKRGKVINGKSALSLLSLGAKFGVLITVQASGEAQAMAELGNSCEKNYQE